ncbi:flagellar biosynthetic protein FliO [Rhizobium leguminosarum]|uniref:flagellar biosynthetic protein FliO n=2 Tax=Rhizobium leguminosarum TaxID=384 RepID=UPI00103CA3A9|nr:flagellar biosynthetic protein FliO [Rhizobium leguminosarum]NKK01294.1 flagellar biosynthesis protein FliO [Rhizobium leguminosarum bv. viciae]QIO71174.1 flagellar biosynthesis protein FliO [Rhizobium leguminosarum bv. trifolii]QIO78189.1 flagellar biosynthesis protein FliO [Rhizobium leguminosarum bv. trifolii]TBZ52031.1 flagellar biosynthesis protein FliO [Rhizobium leguminosarum bv. viciae]TCA26892.1 flagellar biosynthesis protein FliO [Rhizobium leguminosarum bv. viciae]
MTMLDDVVGAYGSRFLLAAGGVGLALLLLIIVLWVIRSRAPSPFVRGGRNRQPRLQVLDAAAVDARRRLVLVRRDDVEHLIMIGGPSDIVIESRILPAAAEQPDSASRPQPVEQRPISVARPETPPVSPPRPPVAARVEPAAEPTFSAPVSPEPRPRPEPSAQPPAPPAVAPPVVTSPLPAEPMTAPLSAERDNPLRAVPPQPRPPERPAAPPAAQPAPFHDASSAAEILDAARQRVLPQQRIEPEVSAPSVQDMPAAARAAPATAEDEPAAQPAAAIRHEFQRVLEEEMSNNLTAERIVPAPANQAPRQAVPQPGNLPRRDPELAPITGADTELQKEVARIFGEMSVNRDK